MFRVTGLVFAASNNAVWAVLTKLEIIGEYSPAIRAMINGWAQNAWRYDESGIPGDLDFRLLAHMGHIRHNWAPGRPNVDPWADMSDGLKYGTDIGSTEVGVQVRVVGVNWNEAPQLKVLFQKEVDPARIRAIAVAFGLTLPQFDDPVYLPGHISLESDSVGTAKVTAQPTNW